LVWLVSVPPRALNVEFWRCFRLTSTRFSFGSSQDLVAFALRVRNVAALFFPHFQFSILGSLVLVFFLSFSFGEI
jgi:hypothetical protein